MPNDPDRQTFKKMVLKMLDDLQRDIEADARRQRWAETPVTFVSRIVCPYCSSPRRILVRSASQGDGSQCQRCVCSACSSRYRIVRELPSSGSSRDWFTYDGSMEETDR